MEALDQDLLESEIELPAEPMLLNVGPAHPAMHGTVRIVRSSEYDIEGGGHNCYQASATFSIDRYVSLRFPTALFTPTDVAYSSTRSDSFGSWRTALAEQG